MKYSFLSNEKLIEWLKSNSSSFLELNDKIEKVVILNNTIKNDPNALELGLTFDSKYEIQPKAIFTTIDKKGKIHLGIIEISSSAIGLKDIGVLHTYAKMVKPKYALLLCENSYSKELTYLLTDPKIGPRLLEFTQGNKIFLLDLNF